MKLQTSKIKSYVGFAIKSRQICFGTDEILKSKNAEIILFSSKLSENSKHKIQNFASERQIPACEVESNELSEIISSETILAFAVTDKNLSKAVYQYIQK